MESSRDHYVDIKCNGLFSLPCSRRIPVVSPTTSSPTYEVDSPTSNVSSPMLICQLLREPTSKIRFRLARQWMKERRISCVALSVGFTYLVACLARQWIKERGIIDMRVTKSGPLFCSLAMLAN